jgi:hypothetical protein
MELQSLIPTGNGVDLDPNPLDDQSSILERGKENSKKFLRKSKSLIWWLKFNHYI